MNLLHGQEEYGIVSLWASWTFAAPALLNTQFSDVCPREGSQLGPAPASKRRRTPAFHKGTKRGAMQARLFIGNLGWNVSEADLAQLAAPHADVLDTKVITDRDTGRSRGFGFMTVEADNVQDVIRALDGQELDGRAIRVNEAEDRPPRDRGHSGGSRRRDRY